MTAPAGNGEETLIKEAEKTFARTRRMEMAVVAVACIAAISALCVTVWLVRLVADCTNPGGECFEKGKRANIQFRDDLRDLIRDVGQCQTLQLLQHRDANERAHVAAAGAHHYHYAAPAHEAVPVIPEALEQACDQFIPKAQGGTR